MHPLKNLIFLLLFFVGGLTKAYSQGTVGRQKVDQFPINKSNTLTYGLTWIPSDYDTDTTNRYPLIIFLHGAGECGDSISGLSKLISAGLPMKIAQGWDPQAISPIDGKLMNFIVVSPQAPALSRWSYSYTHVRYILADVIKRYKVDESRIYITGISAGGAGTWSSVTNNENFTKKIAAIVPVSAVGVNNPDHEAPNIQYIGKYGVRVWAICGQYDAQTRHNVNSINTINSYDSTQTAPAAITLFPNLGHTSAVWNTAYEAKWRDNQFRLNIYEWMLRNVRHSISVVVPTTNAARIK